MSLCDLCVSVVKFLEKTPTTEAQRSHKGTEINFSDRHLSGQRSSSPGVYHVNCSKRSNSSLSPRAPDSLN